jgi:sRNA-binding carbon storage regulator CsrA
LSYQKVRIQVFVPDGLLDAEGKVGGEYLVFDPTGQQAIPAFTNAQRLGIGAPVIIDVVRKVIQIKKVSENEKKIPEKKKDNSSPKTAQPTTAAAT